MTNALGIIGIGAFGEFMLKHITPHFRTCITDKHRDVAHLAATYNLEVTDMAGIAACDIIVLATPVRQFEEVAKTLSGKLRKGQLVIEVGSVKTLPAEVLQKNLSAEVDIVGLHPLFGPQSGKNGIAGLNITICNVRGGRAACVQEFLSARLGLNTIVATPEQHDKELAYVQGLTHLIGKVFVALDLPQFAQSTKSYDLLCQMVELVRYDSDELFRTIEKDNPFSAPAKKDFFAAVNELEKKLGNGS